eukprot:COSAG02_NODE_8398_length_2585_cov_9.777957_2_plen_321_part_00
MGLSECVSSWGEAWGEKGYVRVARGSDQCGLTSQPVYPTVDITTPLPIPTPPLPVPTPTPDCPDGFVCYGFGEEADFYAAYKNGSCGDQVALIGAPDAPATLDASISKRCPKGNGPCHPVPFDLSQPKGTLLMMQDVVISGAHRMWVSEASFVRVTFRDNAGWSGGMGGVASNGGLLTVSGRANLTDCVFKNSKAVKGGCLSNYLGHINATNCVFDTCSSEQDGGGILNHGRMTLTNATFINNTATGRLAKGIGDNAGADCVCALVDAPGYPSAAAQCVGCRPEDRNECHAMPAGKVQPGQPTFYCPGPQVKSSQGSINE